MNVVISLALLACTISVVSLIARLLQKHTVFPLSAQPLTLATLVMMSDISKSDSASNDLINHFAIL